MADFAKASLTISFVAYTGDGNSLTMEVVAEDNNNKTTFYPGDTVYFRLYQIGTFNYEIGTTSGNIVFQSSSTSSEDEDLIFENTADPVSLSKPATSLTSTYWYGRSLGTLTLVGESSVKAANVGYAVANVKYTSPYKLYALQNACSSIPAGLDKFAVLIYANEVI
jgi:hypothetical protein